MAKSLIQQHVPDRYVSFGFDRAVRRFGQTMFRNFSVGITLSAPLVEFNDESRVRDTILHEIAHVLAGPNHDHDNHWRNIALSIGGNGRTTSSAVTPPKRWVGSCVGCDTVFYADRLSDRRKRSSCSKCSGNVWRADRLISWTRNPEFAS